MNIRFSNEKAFERFNRCSLKTEGMKESLGRCVERIMRWQPYDATCVIGCDWDDLSFWFCEEMADGTRGMNGGIIFHGKRDNGGDGNGPTFAVCLEPTDGYSIHT